MLRGSRQSETRYQRLKDTEIDIDQKDEAFSDDDDNGPSFWRLLALAAPEKCLMFWATLALIVSALSNLAVPKYIGVVIDTISSDDPSVDRMAELNKAVLTVSVIVGVGSIFSFVRGYLFTLAGERVVARLRKQLFESIISQEVGMFDLTRTGDLVNRLSSDTTILKNAVTVNISMGLRWIATIVGGIAYLFYISWKLTLIMLAIVPVAAIGARYYGSYIRQLAKETQDALAKATEVAEESFSNVRTVKSFSKEDYQMFMYGKRVDETYRLGAKTALFYGFFIGFMGLIGLGAILLVLWFGAKMVLNGELRTGLLTSFLLYTVTIAGALAGVSGLFSSFMQAMGANTRVFQLIDRIAKIPVKGGDEPREDGEGVIEFRNVNFNYPSRKDIQVIHDLSFTFESGKVTALCGESGGGKSTIVSLIERFYDPSEGSIVIDDMDLVDIDPKWLHRNVALVSQEPVLFACSIRDNIAYGLNNVDDKDIMDAAIMANAHDFITGFTDGYDTMVGERGLRLSGGQKQRIAIARAILMNPKILLLDEATSALDAESEHLVQEALDRMMEGRTVLVVAHRLSTVKNADLVVVIEQGKIVETGTHRELLEVSGVYANLVKHQLEGLSRAKPNKHPFNRVCVTLSTTLGS